MMPIGHVARRASQITTAVALADGELHPDQHALLHGIAATLDCPLPLDRHAGIAA